MTSVVTSAAPNSRAAGESKPAAREQRTLGELYDQFGSIAYGLAFCITNQRVAAERIVTEAFGATWQQLRRNEISHAGFFAALMTVVRTRALALLPRRRATRLIAVVPQPSGDSLQNAVATALGDLPDAQRRVLALAYFGGLAVGDIALELQEPMSHVKANLQAAMRHLRSVLSHRSSGAVSV